MLLLGAGLVARPPLRTTAARRANDDRTDARTLETPLGPVNFTMTEATHVFLHTESRNDEAITIRGIPYHVSYHCHLVDGQWTAKDYNNPYLSRKDCYKDASQAARNTARKTLAKAGPNTFPASETQPASRAS